MQHHLKSSLANIFSLTHLLKDHLTYQLKFEHGFINFMKILL